MQTSPLLIAALAPLALTLAPQAGVDAQDPIEIDEWTVPWEQTRPRDPHVGPAGKVWFVGQQGHYVASFDPSTERFERFDLDDGTGPHNLVVDEDGIVWYTGNRANHIGRLDPATGDIEKFMMPDPEARDPHTLIFDRTGDMWFTVQGGNFVGHFDKETGESRLVAAPQAETRRGMGSSRPYGIKMDSEDRPWATLFGTNKIATVDPETMEMTTFDLPDEDARPRRLVVDSNDLVWYVDYALGQLGRLDPATGEVRVWDSPGGEGSRPYGVAIDADDRVWYVEGGSDPDQFVGFDPNTETFISVTQMEPGRGTVRHMYYDEEHNVIWYGSDRNTIGRANLPPLSGRPVS